MTEQSIEIAEAIPVPVLSTNYLFAVIHEQYITETQWLNSPEKKEPEKPITLFLRDTMGEEDEKKRNDFPPCALRLKSINALGNKIDLWFENIPGDFFEEYSVFSAKIEKWEHRKITISIAFSADQFCLLWKEKLKQEVIVV